MNPTTMAGKPMFPIPGSNLSDGEPDAVKVARPVRWGGGGMAQTSRSNPAIGGAVPTQFYLRGRDGQGDGIGRRQCTTNYKIRPIRRKIRELLGLRPRHRVPAGTTVEVWLGISTDEFRRTRPSRDRWIRNRYPLIEAGMSRWDCLAWWSARYDRRLERSACVACPYQSRQRWVETMRRWPELFAEAVEIDANMRRGLAFAKEPYLHPRRIPLAEAVRLDQAEMDTALERDGFVNECEGHCGV